MIPCAQFIVRRLPGAKNRVLGAVLGSDQSSGSVRLRPRSLRLERMPAWTACRGMLCLLLGFFPWKAVAAPPPAHVVLITIDGLGAQAWQDPQTSMPTLRRLASEGASASTLTVCNPTTTWPNHTSLVTGVRPDRHGVIHNGKLIRLAPGMGVRLDEAIDQRELVAVPTIFDRLHALGARTAAVNWPATRGSVTLDDNMPDAPDLLDHTTPRLRAELLRAGILASHHSAEFRRLDVSACDQAWVSTAVHLLHQRRPRLLLLHLLATDYMQHRYGPQSPAARSAIALADARVAEVLRGLDAAGLREQTSVFIVSDHGFSPVRHLVSPNVLLRQAGLLRPAPRRQVEVLSQGGTAFVYFSGVSSDGADGARVQRLFATQEGIARVLRPAEWESWHLPSAARNPQMGDLVLEAGEGYFFGEDPYEEQPSRSMAAAAGGHGNPASVPEMQGVLIVAGAGIRRGVALPRAEIIDVAPTMARLLGCPLPEVDGRVLKEILEDP